ncbi:MAG TPA: chromate transporter [Burkholderiaceae bacterium]|nr:chromate transporter [Burkholderiaceae bacterium]
MTAADLLGLFGHYLLLSMLAIGGAIATAPDMHRYVVVQQHWITDSQFTSSVALAQAAPGPNLLFVAVIGWNVAGIIGVLVTMVGILLPSTTFTLGVSRWGHARRESRGVRAFTAGMAPLTIGLVLASGWVLTEPSRGSPGAIALVAVSALAMLRTKINPLWLVALGALVGGLGLA